MIRNVCKLQTQIYTNVYYYIGFMMPIVFGLKTVWWKRFCWYWERNVEKEDIKKISLNWMKIFFNSRCRKSIHYACVFVFISAYNVMMVFYGKVAHN